MSIRMFTRLGKAKTLGASALASALILCAPAAFAQDQTNPDQANAVETQASAPETILPAETPWYEAFTLSLDQDLPPSLDETLPTLDWEANSGRWGLTLGIRDEVNEPLELDDVSAEAFVNVGDRFRFGGQVRFTAPEDDLFMISPDDEERAPEIKFESALRF